MKACASTLVATCTKFANEVPQRQVLVPLVFDAQWYSSEREPPGKRKMRVPISLSSEIVVGVSKLLSQMAVFNANHRVSAARIACVRFTFRCTTAGAGFGVS